MIKPKISIRIYKDSKMVKSIASRKVRRIYHFIKANNFSDCLYKVQIFYGDNINNEKEYKTKLVLNEGDYKTKKELIYALKNFLEE